MPVLEVTERIDLSVYTERNWNVILHNDDYTPFQIVISAIMDVVGHSETESRNIMMEAHTNGKAIVVTTNKIVAETYKQQLQEYQLTISLDQA